MQSNSIHITIATITIIILKFRSTTKLEVLENHGKNGENKGGGNEYDKKVPVRSVQNKLLLLHDAFFIISLSIIQ